MALHEQSVGASDEWYTPPHVFRAMAVRFDMDVSSPGVDQVSWIPASCHVLEDSLSKEWLGFVWMNAPFGRRNGLAPWLAKFFDHGNGVALTPDRTSAPWWQEFASKADAVLFVSPKLHFIPGSGVKASSPAQGTTLFAAGRRGVEALQNAARAGLGLLLSSQTEASQLVHDEQQSHTDGLVERLRDNGQLPLCPYDRRSPDYWTTPDDQPCAVCGQLNDPNAPILCRGADTRLFSQAADRIQEQEKEIERLRSALSHHYEQDIPFSERQALARAALSGGQKDG